jgi:hypothetical protein
MIDTVGLAVKSSFVEIIGVSVFVVCNVTDAAVADAAEIT